MAQKKNPETQLQQSEAQLQEIKNDISKDNVIFCQYRPCKRDINTIYDIENIKHGVVYARSPLAMNDPFDSQIGFSAKTILEECIDAVLEFSFVDVNLRNLMSVLLKHKTFGSFGKLLVAMNDMRKTLQYLQKQQHQTHLSFKEFIHQNGINLYAQLPNSTKETISKNDFLMLCNLVASFENVNIDEATLNQMLNVDNQLEDLQKVIETYRDREYIPLMREFISKLTVSCFSSSGWNNPLMWSHYANSYEGICVEYDSSQFNKNVGYLRRVEYSKKRPVLSLKDMGISFEQQQNGNKKTIKSKRTPYDQNKIIKYLTTKDTCWEYEKEWRIINIEKKANSSRLIETPFIKSVTLGLHIDPFCKRFLLDVCKNKGIDCYELELSHDSFEINRRLIDQEALEFDINAELRYVEQILSAIQDENERLTQLMDSYNVKLEKYGTIDIYVLIKAIAVVSDMVSNVYYYKYWLNRFCDNIPTNLDLSKFTQANVTLDTVIDDTLTNFEELLSNPAVIANKQNVQFLKDTQKLVDFIKKYKNTPWHSRVAHE